MKPTTRLEVVVVVLFAFFHTHDGCGTATHMIIAHRAKNYYRQVTASHDYRSLIDKHDDAFVGGSPFPDAFFSDYCYDGMYYNVSKDSQWAPFLNATINYIRKQPKPWNNATEKLVVFTLAMMSHQVSDSLWYGQDIDQGFIPTMGYINFHGNNSNAKESSNFGGDIITNYMYTEDFIDPQDNWYIPVDDLFNIYKEFYGSQVVDRDAIETCSTIMLVEAIVEIIGSAELFQDVANTSPFLVDHILDYFIGGVENMASWSNRKWHDAVTLIEEGPSACTIPQNSIFINCSKSRDKTFRPSDQSIEVYNQNKRQHIEQSLLDEVEITRAYRGVHIRPGPKLRAQIRERNNALRTKEEKLQILRQQEMKPKATDDVGKQYAISYFVESSDSLLGWALASTDIDGDGNDDVVIGAPGYSKDEDPQMGRIYVVYGSVNGLPRPEHFYYSINLDNLTLGYNRIISGESKAMSKFGFSVAILDVNLDGKMDVVVGAPGHCNDGFLGLNGIVYIYFGSGNKREWKEADVLVTCQAKYCSLGYSLTASDVTGDGHPDVVIGSPFMSSNSAQKGFVTALPSASTYKGQGQKIPVESLKWKLEGDQTYSWFGYNLYSRNDVLLISQPYYRKCTVPSCPTFSETDIQSVGKLTLMNMGTKMKINNMTFTGRNQFNMAGYSTDVGDPFGNGSVVLAVGVPVADVDGEILTVPVTLTQAGTVVLYMVSGSNLIPIAHYDSDRRYSRFGSLVRFADINHDGIDDLLIGSPYRNEDATEILDLFFHGQLYGFYGGQHFPLGNATYTRKCKTVSPCPHKVANVTTQYYGSDKSFFGNNAVVLHFKNQTQIVVGASRNTDSDYYPYTEESGRVYAFNTWK